jgi:hypothetical protein
MSVKKCVQRYTKCGVNTCKLIVKVIINSKSMIRILGQNSSFSSGLSCRYVYAVNKTT